MHGSIKYARITFRVSAGFFDLPNTSETFDAALIDSLDVERGNRRYGKWCYQLQHARRKEISKSAGSQVLRVPVRACLKSLSSLILSFEPVILSHCRPTFIGLTVCHTARGFGNKVFVFLLEESPR